MPGDYLQVWSGSSPGILILIMNYKFTTLKCYRLHIKRSVTPRDLDQIRLFTRHHFKKLEALVLDNPPLPEVVPGSGQGGSGVSGGEHAGSGGEDGVDGGEGGGGDDGGDDGGDGVLLDEPGATGVQPVCSTPKRRRRCRLELLQGTAVEYKVGTLREIWWNKIWVS